jgi:hypothetical protein
MLLALGVLSVVAGTVLACVSRRFPSFVWVIEIGAGFLLIGGLALSSCALPIVL